MHNLHLKLLAQNLSPQVEAEGWRFGDLGGVAPWDAEGQGSAAPWDPGVLGKRSRGPGVHGSLLPLGSAVFLQSFQRDYLAALSPFAHWPSRQKNRLFGE